ncbi:sugar ABC transporter substrate-binding protein [Leucobacter luti]|uniref:ABC-type sugar transport system substrate-binding protein n=1 Tax=Leucobacter luti TaxID=340320 RepID=A0A4R6S810_9MICO|nr:sugar ABC transporter substrate-binding protein [Leucobacter luti]MCW2288501.1 ABC-type sugar transport system substrate-binding protein [Leucobacter luti]QYM75559.1 sugar ABC transporter substrate-binding protein [Leucobacter luti]TCK45343.1 ABC-type sugar transport system substrate-binding protein [Leucobacter luti]TDP95871.1 ABC-type sugar transport system substrate-binding protein [Leucobacter luti]
MKRMRRTLAVVALTASTALALAGCTSGGGSDAGSGAGSGGADKGAVAMSFAGLDIQIWNDMLPFMETAVTDAGYEFVTDDPKWNAQTQVQDWESWIVRGDIKAIMGYPVQSDAMVAVTSQATDAGIPVLGYGSTWEGVAGAVVLDHEADGREAGTRAAEWIKEKYGDEQVDVAFLGWPDTDLGRLRGKGMLDALDAAKLNLNITEHKVLSLDDGYAAVQNQLNAVPNTKVWLAIANDPALGAYQALTDSGVSPTDESMLLVNLDATDAELEIIAEPQSFWRYAFIAPARELAEANAQMLIDAAEGKSVTDETVPTVEVTADNADQYLLANQ